MIFLKHIGLLPPNLAQLGLKRAVPQPNADLITIWKTPYPVLTRYKEFCEKVGLKPFAGGSYEQQGDQSEPGYITSGYRDEGLEGRENSPHAFALAIDVVIGDAVKQVKLASIATQLFMRVGIYPDKGILHLDLCSLAWMERFGGRRYWVCIKGHYTSFDDLQSAAHFALKTT